LAARRAAATSQRTRRQRTLCMAIWLGRRNR
jgi:hypothetical protein